MTTKIETVAPEEPKPELTTRQKEVLQLVGKNTHQIAKILGIRPETVHRHFYARLESGDPYPGIYSLLGVQSRTGAVVEGFRQKYLLLPKEPRKKPQLTASKLQILKLTAQELTFKAIALKLEISQETVKHHFVDKKKINGQSGIYELFGLKGEDRNVAMAVRRAIELRLLKIDEI